MDEETKIKKTVADHLSVLLNRQPSPAEITNAETDSLLLIKVLTEELSEIQTRVSVLEKIMVSYKHVN